MQIHWRSINGRPRSTRRGVVWPKKSYQGHTTFLCHTKSCGMTLVYQKELWHDPCLVTKRLFLPFLPPLLPVDQFSGVLSRGNLCHTKQSLRWDDFYYIFSRNYIYICILLYVYIYIHMYVYMHRLYIYISGTVGEDVLFSMIIYYQASNKIDSQFYIEQLLKPENSLRTTGFEPVPVNARTVNCSLTVC